MVAFGSLIKCTDPKGIDLGERISFLGMGFSSNGIPVDIVALFLAGLAAKGYAILLVDEFQRFNHVPEEHISLGLKRIRRALNGLGKLYGFGPEIITCSDFMRSDCYKAVLKEIEERIKDCGLEDSILQTVPERYRQSLDAAKYPVNEIACVEFLKRERGIEIKLGPSKELIYDRIMRELGLDVDFAYVIDAYALGTREPEEVVHYIPGHRGRSNGQRLLLDDPVHKADSKIALGPDEATRYLLSVASEAGFRMGRDYLEEDEIRGLYGKKLRKTARELVIGNILKPYKEVAEYEGQ